MNSLVKPLALFCCALSIAHSSGQQDTGVQHRATQVNLSVFDGIVVAGYVDAGAYLNFTGPSICFDVKKSKLIFGMMPSLRLKKDEATPRNSYLTPNLGFGVTYCYRKFAIQVPFYYNPKTTTRDGAWSPGIGIGLRLKT